MKKNEIFDIIYVSTTKESQMKKKLMQLSLFVIVFTTVFLISFLCADKTKSVWEVVTEEQPCVYITIYGSKYHAFDCFYLKSRIARGLREARNNGYTLCSYCHGISNNTILIESTICKEIDNTKAATIQSVIIAFSTSVLYGVMCGFSKKLQEYYLIHRNFR